MNTLRQTVLSTVTTALLIGCGGGSDGDDGGTPVSNPPAPLAPTQAAAEGAYGGTLSGSTSSDFQMLILENGEFWGLYGNDAGSIFYAEGFVQGSGSSSDGSSYTSSVRDYGFYPAPIGTLASTFNSTAKTIIGAVTYSPIGTVQFSGGTIPGSLYNYAAAASLKTIAGSWSAMSSTGGSVAVTVAGNGLLTVNESGCVGIGTIVPRASGRNVFNVSVKFGGSPCLLPNQTATGIGIAYPLTTGQMQLIAAIRSAAGDAGISVFAIR